MGGFIFAIVLLVFAAVAVFAALFVLPPRLKGNQQDNRRGFPIRFATLTAAGLLGFFAIVSAVGSVYDTVGTRMVGIVTQFGRPVAVRTAGIAWHWPWQHISELTEAIQLQSFESQGYDDASKGTATTGASGAAVQVRLANGSTAYVNENLNWRLREGAAPKLFQDYGGSTTDVFDVIKQQLVDRQAQTALAKVFSSFNPQEALDAHGNPTTDPNVQVKMVQPDYAKFADQVKVDLQDAVGAEIDIIDVRIPAMFFDGNTQGRIDGFNQKVQETRNAQQDIQTAIANREASKQRAEQPAPDLKVAQFNCIQEAVTQHRPADAAGCFGQIGGNPLIQMPR